MSKKKPKSKPERSAGVNPEVVWWRYVSVSLMPIIVDLERVCARTRRHGDVRTYANRLGALQRAVALRADAIDELRRLGAVPKV